MCVPADDDEQGKRCDTKDATPVVAPSRDSKADNAGYPDEMERRSREAEERSYPGCSSYVEPPSAGRPQVDRQGDEHDAEQLQCRVYRV